MSGNLSYQVEHHLFPDLPSSRYAEIAPQVKDVCERYGLPYNSGPVHGSSSAWCSGRSCGWPFPAESRGRSRAPTERLSRT